MDLDTHTGLRFARLPGNPMRSLASYKWAMMWMVLLPGNATGRAACGLAA